MTFGLAVSYKWKYDKELVDEIEKISRASGISTFIINKENVFEITDLVKDDKISFKVYLDRASDEDEDFEELAHLLFEKETRIINPYEKVELAIDKSIMHEKLTQAHIHTPKTFIIPPYEESPNLSTYIENLAFLGKPFVIKPAYYSGGGEGVITDAKNTSEIDDARKIYKDDSYLVQEKIYPKLINGNRAWFRSLWLFDKPLPIWWNDITHIYNELTPADIANYGLAKLSEITVQLANITGLDYFSTEIALTQDNRLVVVDYINDQCDFRKKSIHNDGVPDRFVREFILSMLQLVKVL